MGPSAVRQEELLDVGAVGLEQNGRAAQIADLLGGAFDHAVLLAPLGVDDLAGPGDLEALFRARFGLQLGHLALPGLTPFLKFGGAKPRSRRNERKKPPRQPFTAGRFGGRPHTRNCEEMQARPKRLRPADGRARRRSRPPAQFRLRASDSNGLGAKICPVLAPPTARHGLRDAWILY